MEKEYMKKDLNEGKQKTNNLLTKQKRYDTVMTVICQIIK